MFEIKNKTDFNRARNVMLSRLASKVYFCNFWKYSFYGLFTLIVGQDDRAISYCDVLEERPNFIVVRFVDGSKQNLNFRFSEAE